MRKQNNKKSAIARVIGIMTRYNITLLDIQIEFYRIIKGFKRKEK